MPRKADAKLENRILDAAYELWSKRGEKALTMRAVARAAGTTTPTVYQRFEDKRDLLVLLRDRSLKNLVSVLQPAHSPVEVCRRFLAYAAIHPHEYRLLTSDWGARLSRDNEPRPTFEIIKKRLASHLGGEPEQHSRLALALGALLHGTATMLMADGVQLHVARQLRSICSEACETLISSAAAKRDSQLGTQK
ncbi:MAG: helix-turn-helix domain-containing protein [Candidatus Acidiferrales bacterium]